MISEIQRHLDAAWSELARHAVLQDAAYTVSGTDIEEAMEDHEQGARLDMSRALEEISQDLQDLISTADVGTLRALFKLLDELVYSVFSGEESV